MLFGYYGNEGVLNTPNFWMGMVAGIIGTLVVIFVLASRAAQSEKKAETKEEAEGTCWWNGGKKPDFDQDYRD